MLGFRQTSVHVFYFWFIRLHLPRRMNLFLFPPPHRAPESAHRAHRQVRENRPMARAPQTITPTARTQNRPPCPLPAHRVPESNHPRTRSPKSSPETAHIRLLETPQNHPFARAPQTISHNSYSKPAISYNAPRKVLPLTGACLPLHCHQDSNEIQIKK